MNRPGSTSVPPTTVSPLERVIGLPRIAKILLIAFFSLMMVLMLQPAIDYVYLTRYFNTETVIAPALVGVLPGVVMYLIGWGLLLWDGPIHPRALGLYLGIGVFVTTVVVVLLVYGFIWAGQG